MKKKIARSFIGTLLLLPVSFVPLPDPAFQVLAPKSLSSSQPKPGGFLDAVKKHLEEAALKLGLEESFLQKILVPERRMTVVIRMKMDNGEDKSFVGWRVQHSFILGPGKGGIRVKPGLTEQDVQALATEMTIKNAVGGLDLGGAKGGIDADPAKLSHAEYARLIRGYVSAVMDTAWVQYRDIAFGVLADVPAPDVGTSPDGLNLMNLCVDEVLNWLVHNQDKYEQWLVSRPNGEADLFRLPTELKNLAGQNGNGNGLHTLFLDRYWQLYQEGKIPNVVLIGSFTGKAVGKGGSQGRGAATGLGVAYAALETMKHDGKLPKDAARFSGQTVAVQGYGNVGAGAVKAFLNLGAKVTAIAEVKKVGERWVPYAILREEGFDETTLSQLEDYRKANKTLENFPLARTVEIGEFWSLPVDILAPAAAENQITEEVAKRIVAPYVVEGANGPTTPEGDKILNAKKIKVIPDVFANGGGVTVSFFEMEQNRLGKFWTEKR